MTELLSPAGEYESFLGAINAGADAVYLAGNMYGARASAVNFTEEEIIKALNYAHLFGKKIYLTVNTLTKDEELSKLYDFIRPLYLSGLDACIVQDMGVFSFLKECFPSMDLHISTQAVVTSKEGALFYKNEGASRVVLARELTLPEIEDITKAGIETECFIHGAMCYSYSGACLFSSFLGGNSGNRGRCKGPCRQPYKTNGKEDYILSLKDMCTIDILDKLVKADITSFKIEGRLKSPSYSAGVTSVYRKYLDMVLENPDKKYTVDSKDRELLNNLYSRSGSGTGYYDRVKSPKMITFEKGSYNKVDEDDEKKIYDTFIKNPKKLPVNVKVSALCGKPFAFSVKCAEDDKVFANTQSDDCIEVASKSPTSKEDIVKHAGKMGSTPFVVNSIDVDIDNGFVPASLINTLRRDACDELEHKLYDKFMRCDDSHPKTIGNDVVINDDEIYGNRYLSKNTDSLDNGYRRAFVESFEQFEYLNSCSYFDSVVVNADILFDESFEKSKECLKKKLYFECPPIVRKQNSSFIRKCIEKIKDFGFEGVYFNQIDEYMFCKDLLSGLIVCANTNIYAYNSESISFYKRFFSKLQAPVELSFKDVVSLNCKDFEIMLYGRAPLMQTANCIMLDRGDCKADKKDRCSFVTLNDRLNIDFPVRLRCSDSLCFNTIYNSKPNSLHKYFKKYKDLGYNKFSYRFTNESIKEIEEVTLFYNSLEMGENAENPTFLYTNGHLKTGIL